MSAKQKGYYMFDLKVFSDGVSLLGSVVSTVKSVIDILPKREKADALEKLHEVEEKLQIAQAQAAKGLGYELCRCSWPPQIMLHTGEAEYGEKFRCPACGRFVSPDDMPHIDDNWRTI
jgi:hypothetical protein